MNGFCLIVAMASLLIILVTVTIWDRRRVKDAQEIHEANRLRLWKAGIR